MDERLAQAISAARSGQTKEAQVLLTRLLKENPNETQGWFLLSNLVEAPEQKEAFLQRVLALDPSHEKARAQLARVSGKTAVSTPISVSTTDDFMAQATGDTLPDWLADDADNLRLEEVNATFVAEPAEEASLEAELELPDWLRDENGDTLDEAESPETAVAKKPQKVLTDAPKNSPGGKAKQQEKTLTWILYGLVVVAVIVVVLLIYLALNTL